MNIDLNILIIIKLNRKPIDTNALSQSSFGVVAILLTRTFYRSRYMCSSRHNRNILPCTLTSSLRFLPVSRRKKNLANLTIRPFTLKQMARLRSSEVQQLTSSLLQGKNVETKRFDVLKLNDNSDGDANEIIFH